MEPVQNTLSLTINVKNLVEYYKVFRFLDQNNIDYNLNTNNSTGIFVSNYNSLMCDFIMLMLKSDASNKLFEKLDKAHIKTEMTFLTEEERQKAMKENNLLTKLYYISY